MWTSRCSVFGANTSKSYYSSAIFSVRSHESQVIIYIMAESTSKGVTNIGVTVYCKIERMNNVRACNNASTVPAIKVVFIPLSTAIGGTGL